MSWIPTTLVQPSETIFLHSAERDSTSLGKEQNTKSPQIAEHCVQYHSTEEPLFQGCVRLWKTPHLTPVTIETFTRRRWNVQHIFLESNDTHVNIPHVHSQVYVHWCVRHMWWVHAPTARARYHTIYRQNNLSDVTSRIKTGKENEKGWSMSQSEMCCADATDSGESLVLDGTSLPHKSPSQTTVIKCKWCGTTWQRVEFHPQSRENRIIHRQWGRLWQKPRPDLVTGTGNSRLETSAQWFH